jgi:valyl-tRNA synthetase
MDSGLSRSVCAVFKRLYDEGLIYKDNYLVNWCPRCLTTLSDDEVEYSDRPGKLWHLRYPVEGEPGRFAVVATTRPETMLGDTAVAVNPSDERYKDWVGKHVILPLVNRRIPVIADDFVEKSFGTGMVKITPAHDPNDYQAGKRHGLPEINVLTPDAKINNAAPAYEGLDRYEARKRVLADLEAQQLIEKIEDHTQRAGECYRCHTVIEPYVSLQWFVKVAPLAEPARQAVHDGRVKFIPKARERDYYHWLDNLRDWCISRQLWWGHRVPAWTCEACGNVTVMDSEEPPSACQKCGGTKLAQDPDVLDTWFSSALWPFSTLGWPDDAADLRAYYPTSTLVTAKDIIFLWVARMVMMGLHFLKQVPFDYVYFNPIVGDEHGKKMSKSKGNAIDPLDLMEEYGTDALRFTLCDYATQDQHIAFSVKRCEGYRNFMNKLWNASRLIFANIDDLSAEAIAHSAPVAGPARDTRPLEDRWILSRYARTVRTVNSALEGFEFDTAVKAVYDFFWKDFCDYYLELVKPRLYAKSVDDDAPRTQAQAMLIVVLEGALRLLHPFCPFITEELWTAMRGKWQGGAQAGPGFLGSRTLEAFAAPSVMVAPWNSFAPDSLLDEAAEQNMDILQDVIYTIRNIRGEMKIPPGTPAAVTLICPNPEVKSVLEQHTGFFETLTNIRSLGIFADHEAPASAATGIVRGIVAHVELPEELRQQEIARLEKELARVTAEFERLGAKLADGKFAAKAPEAVVEKEREKQRRAGEDCDQFEAKLRKLRE